MVQYRHISSTSLKIMILVYVQANFVLCAYRVCACPCAHANIHTYTWYIARYYHIISIQKNRFFSVWQVFRNVPKHVLYQLASYFLSTHRCHFFYNLLSLGKNIQCVTFLSDHIWGQAYLLIRNLSSTNFLGLYFTFPTQIISYLFPQRPCNV